MNVLGKGLAVLALIAEFTSSVASAAPSARSPGLSHELPPAINASVGRQAPDFTLKDLSGRTWRLSEMRARKIVVLQFASTSCACGQRAVFDLQSVYDLLGERGVQTFAIGFEQQPLVPPQQFMTESRLTIPFLTDPGLRTAKAYGVRWPVSVIVIDRLGVVRWACDEFSRDVFQRTKATLEPLVAGDEAWLADRSYGRLFAAGKSVTVTGVVTRIERTSPQKGLSPALMVTLEKGLLRTRVVVAPAWYAEHKGLRIGLKDSLAVSGVSVRMSPERMVLAAQVRRGKEAFQMRDSSGRFPWAALLQTGKQ